MGLNRREFCEQLAAFLAGNLAPARAARLESAYRFVAQTDRERTLKAATEYLSMPPVTITSFLRSEPWLPTRLLFASRLFLA